MDNQVSPLSLEQQNQIFNLLAHAGKAIMGIFNRKEIAVETKSDLTPVTVADKLSGTIVREGLFELFPDIPVVDEESEIPAYSIRREWRSFFLLDPLDGTREFINKSTEFSINLALMENNRPTYAWIYRPSACRGWYCNIDSPLQFFGDTKLPDERVGHKDDNSITLVTSRSHLSKLVSALAEKLSERYPVRILRMGSALKQVEVALGNADFYLRGSGCSEWDTAAGHLLVERSGGETCLWDLSGTLVYNKPNLANPPFMMISGKCRVPGLKYVISGLAKGI